MVASAFVAFVRLWVRNMYVVFVLSLVAGIHPLLLTLSLCLWAIDDAVCPFFFTTTVTKLCWYAFFLGEFSVLVATVLDFKDWCI